MNSLPKSSAIQMYKAKMPRSVLRQLTKIALMNSVTLTWNSGSGISFDFAVVISFVNSACDAVRFGSIPRSDDIRDQSMRLSRTSSKNTPNVYSTLFVASVKELIGVKVLMFLSTFFLEKLPL